MPTSTTPRRVARARQRFFEEGPRPDGPALEAVIRSWGRCAEAHREPGERVAFAPLARSQVAVALARHRPLLDAARPELVQLEAVLAGTGVKVLLSSPDGVILHATPTGRHAGSPMPAMHFAAAPIRGVRGQVVGVLGLSSEGAGGRIDALAQVGLQAPAEARHAEEPAASPVRLDEANRSLIERTLAECKGNVSRAARVLGVSRGLLYRRLAEWQQASDASV